MTVISDRTPVLVGAGQVVARPGEVPLVEAATLMVQAARAAAGDAGSSRSEEALLAAVDAVWVPEGTWKYGDAGGLVADRIGAAGATSACFRVGVTQQAMLTAAVLAVAEGRHRAVLVVGGEARHHARAAAAGAAAPETRQDEAVAPAVVVAGGDLGILPLEIERDLVTPATAYAVIDHVLGHAAGLSPLGHRERLGDLWARLGTVAARNPFAWDRSAPTARQILEVGPENRPIADPYPKRLCSQWNVDQAAAVIVASAGWADRMGVPRDRFVFPHSSTVADHPTPVVARDDLGRSVGAELAGPRCLELAGVDREDLGPADLYSCFPAAVQIYADALGWPLEDPDRPWTTTGGMAFAGGPLNSYVLHALAAMVPDLRRDPTRVGLSTSVSVVVTKQGFGLWGASPPARGFRHQDLTAVVAASPAARARPVEAGWSGPATVVSWTVTYRGSEPDRAVVVAENADGVRTIAESTDDDVVGAMAGDGQDWIGRTVAVDAGGLRLI